MRQLVLILKSTNQPKELPNLRPQVPDIFLVLLIGNVSNGETVFEVTREHCGVSTTSSISVIRAYYACI